MAKKYFLIIIIAILLILSGNFYYQKINNDVIKTNKTYPSLQNFDFYSVSDIKQKNLASGTYNTEGYVYKRFECLPCPQGAQCKPCMKDHIVVSENNKPTKTYIVTDTEIIVFVNKSKQFGLGKKYRFSIKLLDYKTTNEPINDIELIGYQ